MMKMFYIFVTCDENDKNYLFNYVLLIDEFEYTTVECKEHVIVTNSGYSAFKMWVALGCTISVYI